MIRRLNLQQAAELMGIKVGAVLLLAALLLGLPALGDLRFLGACAAFAAALAAAWHVCRQTETYVAYGRRAMVALRGAQCLALGAAGFVGPLQGEGFWILAVPVVLIAGLVERSGKNVGSAAAAACLGPLAAWALEGGETPLMAVATLAMAAVMGWVLGVYREREEALRSRNNRLDTVLQCAASLAASADLRSLILHTIKAAVSELDASCGYVMLTQDEARDTLVTEAAYGIVGGFKFPERLTVGDGVTGYAVKMGQPIAIHNSEEEQLDVEGVSIKVRSIVSVPLVARNYMGPAQASNELVLGALTLLGTHENSFASAEDMQLLRSLAALVAEAVANARMEERQRSTFLKTLQTLAKSLEARDLYTRGHSERVCQVSLMIGEKLGLTPEALEELRVGTILHDIGKIGVPDAILNKPARLTEEEFAIMKTHPVIGYEICKPLMLSEGVLMIIRNHHEKLDGSGYPDGLKGGELPLSLRIVCVADAFDAMSSRRPYRDVMAMATVLSELSAGAGVQFDPVVVEALKELLHTERMQECYRGQWDVEEKAA